MMKNNVRRESEEKKRIIEAGGERPGMGWEWGGQSKKRMSGLCLDFQSIAPSLSRGA